MAVAYINPAEYTGPIKNEQYLRLYGSMMQQASERAEEAEGLYYQLDDVLSSIPDGLDEQTKMYKRQIRDEIAPELQNIGTSSQPWNQGRRLRSLAHTVNKKIKPIVARTQAQQKYKEELDKLKNVDPLTKQAFLNKAINAFNQTPIDGETSGVPSNLSLPRDLDFNEILSKWAKEIPDDISTQLVSPEAVAKLSDEDKRRYGLEEFSNEFLAKVVREGKLPHIVAMKLMNSMDATYGSDIAERVEAVKNTSFAQSQAQQMLEQNARDVAEGKLDEDGEPIKLISEEQAINTVANNLVWKNNVMATADRIGGQKTKIDYIQDPYKGFLRSIKLQEHSNRLSEDTQTRMTYLRHSLSEGSTGEQGPILGSTGLSPDRVRGNLNNLFSRKDITDTQKFDEFRGLIQQNPALRAYVRDKKLTDRQMFDLFKEQGFQTQHIPTVTGLGRGPNIAGLAARRQIQEKSNPIIKGFMDIIGFDDKGSMLHWNTAERIPLTDKQRTKVHQTTSAMNQGNLAIFDSDGNAVKDKEEIRKKIAGSKSSIAAVEQDINGDLKVVYNVEDSEGNVQQYIVKPTDQNAAMNIYGSIPNGEKYYQRYQSRRAISSLEEGKFTPLPQTDYSSAKPAGYGVAYLKVGEQEVKIKNAMSIARSYEFDEDNELVLKDVVARDQNAQKAILALNDIIETTTNEYASSNLVEDTEELPTSEEVIAYMLNPIKSGLNEKQIQHAENIINHNALFRNISVPAIIEKFVPK